MKPSLRKVSIVYRREMAEIRSSKTLIVFVLFAAMQCLLMFVSQAPGKIEDTYLFFMLGGLVAVIACFDIISKEREHRTLDLLLTQGISRQGLFLAKLGAAFTYCFFGTLVVIIGGIVGSFLSGKIPAWGDWLAEFGMTFWLLSIYAMLSLLFSSVFRRGKWALAGAATTWFLMRPAILGNIVLGPLSKLFGWNRSLTWYAAACIPEFAFRLGLDIKRGAPDDVAILWYFPYLVLGIYVIAFAVSAWLVFRNQDEPVS